MPPHFTERNESHIYALARANPLATVVVLCTDGMVANEIPLMVDIQDSGEIVLLGHIAKKNPLVEAANANNDTLVIFRGSEHYISPNWYATKKEHGKVVPTWDYAIVQCHGSIELVNDTVFKLAQVTALTDKMEALGHAPTTEPWEVDDAPADYLAMMLDNIVGIRIPVSRIEAKTKANQNHPLENKVSAAVALREIGSESSVGVAKLIERSAKS